MLMIIRLGGENGGELVHTVVHNNHNQPEVRLLFDPGHNHNHNQPEVRFFYLIMVRSYCFPCHQVTDNVHSVVIFVHQRIAVKLPPLSKHICFVVNDKLKWERWRQIFWGESHPHPLPSLRKKVMCVAEYEIWFFCFNSTFLNGLYQGRS